MFGFLKRRAVDPEAELRKVLGDYELPAFRGTVLRMLDELRSPDSSASSIARVVSLDPGVSTRLLKLVNSPAFASSRSIDTVAPTVVVDIAETVTVYTTPGGNHSSSTPLERREVLMRPASTRRR